MLIRTAVMGASGYAGGELVRLLDDHPEFEVTHLGAHSSAGETLASVHPHLRHGDRMLESITHDVDVDAVFLALPHGASWDIGKAMAFCGLERPKRTPSLKVNLLPS